MRVLWFSPSICGNVRRNPQYKVIRGWLIALEDELKRCPDINLAVSYLSDKAEQPYVFESVMYYPISLWSGNISYRGLLNRIIPSKIIDSKIEQKMEDVVENFHPDIIHIHGTEGSFGLILDYASKKNIPVVFSIQGMIAPYSEKFFSGIPQFDAYRFDSIIDYIKRSSSFHVYQSFRYRAKRELSYVKKAQYVFGRTFWDANCTLSINPQRKYYIVNEILRNDFYNKIWKGYICNGQDKEVAIVSIVSGGIYKGLETALKAAYILKTSGVFNFKWHIVGYSRNTKWVKIAEKSTSLCSDEVNIIYEGKMDSEELSNILSLSDIYVHVSHIENSPNSVCEAMLVGMPIIATYAGGTASLMEHMKDGLLVQDGDPYVLAGSIIRMIQEPENAIAYANSARLKAHFRHSPTKVCEELKSGYKQILKLHNLP